MRETIRFFDSRLKQYVKMALRNDYHDNTLERRKFYCSPRHHGEECDGDEQTLTMKELIEGDRGDGEDDLTPRMLELLRMVTEIRVYPGCRWLEGFPSSYNITRRVNLERVASILNANKKHVYLIFESRENDDVYVYWRDMW